MNTITSAMVGLAALVAGCCTAAPRCFNYASFAQMKEIQRVAQEHGCIGIGGSYSSDPIALREDAAREEAERNALKDYLNGCQYLSEDDSAKVSREATPVNGFKIFGNTWKGIPVSGVVTEVIGSTSTYETIAIAYCAFGKCTLQ